MLRFSTQGLSMDVAIQYLRLMMAKIYEYYNRPILSIHARIYAPIYPITVYERHAFYSPQVHRQPKSPLLRK